MADNTERTQQEMIISAAVVAAAFALHNGDRVVFYGDSITEQRIYTTYVEVFVRTRYPNLKVDFHTAGVGGDTVWGGWTGDPKTRVSRDVAPHKPTRITIMLGMNDGGYVKFDPKVDKLYPDFYEKLIGLMDAAAPGVKYTLIQTSPFDDFTNRKSFFPGYNEILLQYGRHVKEIADRHKGEYLDFNKPVKDAIISAQKVDPTAAESFLPDFIHPGASGHLIMAGELLKHWGAGPLVSSVTIDAAGAKVVASENAKVTNLKGLSWSQLDGSLPFPTNDDMSAGLKYSAFMQNLNQQQVKVQGLDGVYDLYVDGKKAGSAPAAEWANGVNIAGWNTPMKEQSLKVLDLAQKRNEMILTSWMRIGHMVSGFKETPKAARALIKLADEIDKVERAESKPKAHTFELKKV